MGAVVVHWLNAEPVVLVDKHDDFLVGLFDSPADETHEAGGRLSASSAVGVPNALRSIGSH